VSRLPRWLGPVLVAILVGGCYLALYLWEIGVWWID
jgi:hypothetical protein